MYTKYYGMRDDVVEGRGVWLAIGRARDGDEWDIVHDCSSFLCPPFQPFQPAPNLAQDPAVACMAFFFLCFTFYFSPSPSPGRHLRSRSIGRRTWLLLPPSQCS